MTSQVPLLAANGASSAGTSPGEPSRGGAGPALLGSERPFASVLNALPARAGGSAGGKASTGRPAGHDAGGADLPPRGGKALPPSSSTDAAPPTAALQSSAPPGQSQLQSLRQKLEKVLADGGTADGQALSPETVDMLKALLSTELQDGTGERTGATADGSGPSGTPQAPSGGDALSQLLAGIQTQAGGTAPATAGSLGQGAPSGERLLEDLVNRGSTPSAPQAQALTAADGTAAADGGEPFPTGAAQGSPDSFSEALRQWLLQLANGSPTGSQPASAAAQQGAGSGSSADSAVQSLMAQILSQPPPPQQLDPQERRLAAGDRRGAGGSSGAAGVGSSPAPFASVAAHSLAQAPTPGAAGPATPMPQPFNQQAWDQALGQNVTWMAQHNVQAASLRLNPPQLGPLEIQVSVDHDQANVSFVVHHAAVRDAVEAALPKLREMFGEGGVNLANVNVSDNSASGGGTASPDPGENPSQEVSPTGRTGPEAAPAPAAAGAPLGLVDYFA